MRTPKTSFVAFHLLIWGFYFLLPVFLFSDPLQLFASNNGFLAPYILSNALAIALFYYNYFWALPHWYFKNRRLTYFAWSGLVTVGALLLFTFTSHYFTYSDADICSSHVRLSVKAAAIKFLLAFVFSWLLSYYWKTRNTEVLKNQAEAALLKAQINPHFLFNTLNNIYGLAVTRSEHVTDSIAQLSAIMQYLLLDATSNKVPLEKEIAYLQNYINLQMIRLTEKTHVQFDISGRLDGKTIEPLLLISFIENAFKYGVSTEINSDIEIKITIQKHTLHLKVCNMKVAKDVISHGVGLKNTIDRLNLSYPNTYNLTIEEDSNQYNVHLTLPLT